MKLQQVGRRVRIVVDCVEALESRCLLSATLLAQIPTQMIVAGTLPASLKLGAYFDDPLVTGTAVILQTSEGNIPLVLTDNATPKTVANFLRYVNSGEYANTIFHRTVVPPAEPLPFILQGGGYTTTGTHISTLGTIPSEATNPGALKNTAGTISMALLTGPGSATSEWFINLSNNDGTTANPNLDDTSDSGPFTAFGTVVYNGMAVVNTIANLTQVNANVESAAWANLPVLPSYTGPATANANLPASDLVTVNPLIVAGGLTYSIVSSNPNLVSGNVANGALTLTPGNRAGSATITVTATDMGGGTATSTFAVTVANKSPNVMIGSGGAQSVKYSDPNGAVAVVSMKGAGSAVVTFNGTDLSQMPTPKGIIMTGTGLGISSIATSGTSAASILTIAVTGGAKAINVGQIATDALKSIVGKGVTVTGGITSTGTIGAVFLAGATGGTISAGSIGIWTTPGVFSANLTLTGTGLDLNKFSVGSISGGIWTVGGSVNSITAGAVSNWSPTFAGAVNSMKIGGNVSANIEAASIGAFSIKGAVSNSQFHLTGAGNDLNKLTIAGAISQSSIDSTGSIGAVAASALISTEIYAGVAPQNNGTTLPNAAADFASTASIKSIKLKGTSGGDSFSGSDIAATNIGMLSLGTLQTAGGLTATGIVGEAIGFLTATANKKFTLKGLHSGSDVTTLVENMDVMLGQIVIQVV